MEPAEVLRAIETYRQLFVDQGIGKTDYPHGERMTGKILSLEHCHGMLDKMVEYAQEEKMEKVFRWLGFIQGVLWTNGIYTLEHLKNHNKP